MGLDLSTDEGHDALESLGRIPWPDVTDAMREAAALIAALYAGEAITGGPLHIVTDDDNVSDGNLAFCRDNIANFPHPEDYRDWPKVAALSGWILDLLEPLDTKQRAVAISLGHGRLAEIHGKVYMPSTEFPIHEEVRDDDGNIVGFQWGFRHRKVEAS